MACFSDSESLPHRSSSALKRSVLSYLSPSSLILSLGRLRFYFPFRGIRPRKESCSKDRKLLWGERERGRADGVGAAAPTETKANGGRGVARRWR